MSATLRPHGTRAKYVAEKCRCSACTEANRLESQRLMREHLYGRFDALVDAGPAQAHLQRLIAAGISARSVAEMLGRNRKTIQLISVGARERVTKEVAEQILALPVDPVRFGHPGADIEATGAVRRLQALVCIGYTLTDLGDLLGLNVREVSRLTSVEKPRMTRARVRKIRALYDELWDKPQDKPNARAFGHRRGWVPPLAWDDDLIDDPAAVPEMGERTRANGGKFEDMLWVLESGGGWDEALRRGGYASLHAARKAAHRVGRTDLNAVLPEYRTLKDSA